VPHEETRRIIRVGNSLAVTIPAPWVRYYRLEQKDEVTIISNSNIIIEPPSQKQKTKAVEYAKGA
jgi:antitoxin component of MazEF toxin-antitoxin module